MPDTEVTESYITTVELGDAYFAKRLDCAAWTGASSANKSKALQMATRALDSMRWDGVKAVSTQTRQFPRKYKLDPDATNPWGNVTSLDYYGYATATTPQAILDACCEEALALLRYSASTASSARADLIAQGVTSYTLGDLSETFGKGPKQVLKSSEARQLVNYLLGKNVRIV
jgi:hypothetical protein